MSQLIPRSLLLFAALAGCPADESPNPALGTAVELTPEELDELRERGEVFEVGDLSPDEEARRREQLRVEADAAIDAFLGDRPDLRDKLLPAFDSSRGRPTRDGNVAYTLPGGQEVVVYGEDLRRRSLAAALRQRAAPEVQRTRLDALLPIVPGDCRALAPEDPAALGADELAEANAAIARCWDDWRSLLAPFDQVTPGTRPSGDSGSFEAVNPGECDDPVYVANGDDGAADCLPTGQLADFAFTAWPWVDALPPVRNQVWRGSCTAFATASALEFALARRDDRTVDLSEQQLYAFGKFDLYGEHFGDGLPISGFYEDLHASGWGIPLESSWGYNPSWCREDDGSQWFDSCLGYDDACSDTSHQLGLYASEGQTYFFRPGPGNEVVQIAETVPLHDWFIPQLDFANAYLDAGWGVVAGLAVDEAFMDLGNGGDLSQESPFVAYHAVHVVRWVPTPSVSSGGLVLIKNSWGCGWGNGGYAFLPADWFLDHLTDLNAIRPAGVVLNNPPTLTITSPAADVTQDLSPLGNAFQLSAATSDVEDGDDCCAVSWWSSVDGHLGTGATIDVELTTPGPRVVFATIRDSYGAVTGTTTSITLTNQGPDVGITRPPRPGRGLGGLRVGQRVPVDVPIVFGGEASDPNQLEVSCFDRSWSFGIEGERAAIGCDLERSLEPGWYRVEHVAEDDGGTVGSDVRWFRAVGWTAQDAPWVQITSPRPSAAFLADPFAGLELRATAVSGLPDGIESVRWSLERDFGEPLALGEGPVVSWTPSDDVGFTCGGTRATLRVEASDGRGTSVDTLEIYVFYPPC